VPEIPATPATADMISGIGDKNITGDVDSHAFGRVKLSGRRGPIAVMAGRTRPSVRSYNTGYINLADNIIDGIGNVDIAIFIQQDLMRFINTGGHRCRAIAEIRAGAVTSDLDMSWASPTPTNKNQAPNPHLHQLFFCLLHRSIQGIRSEKFC